MAKNFKGEGILTKRLISSETNEPLKIYNRSILDTTTDDGTVLDSNFLNNVGNDVFMFVSGSINSKGTSNRGVTLFGGDLVVSGTLFAERQVIEVDENVPGQLLVSGSLNVSGSSIFNINNSNNSDFTIKSQTKDYALHINSSEDTIQIMSGGNSLSPNESSYTDTNFFVSGSIGSAHQPDLGQNTNGERGTSVFGGDVFVSGSLWAGGTNITSEISRISGSFADLSGSYVNLSGSYVNLSGSYVNLSGSYVELSSSLENSIASVTLKSYVENGNFISKNLVSGDNSVAVGYNNTIDSIQSYIIGNRDNSIHNSNNGFDLILGGKQNTISGSNNAIILGGSSNVISSSSPSYIAYSNNVNIHNIEALSLYSENLDLSGQGQRSIFIGKEIKASGSIESPLSENIFIGNNIEALESKFNFVKNLEINTNETLQITGSDSNFIISRNNNEIVRSKDSFILSKNGNIQDGKRNFIIGNDNIINNVTKSYILSNNVGLSNTNNALLINSDNSSIDNDDISYLTQLKVLQGAQETVSSGNSTIISSEYSQISGSYSGILGGFKNIITGSSNYVLGSNFSQINNVSGSLILGGYNNIINKNKSFILGSNNTINKDDSIIIGNNISSNISSSLILGDGTNIQNHRTVISSSILEFGNLTKEKVYGTDTNFFVSGSMNSRNNINSYGTAVFGGDVHISGSLTGGGFFAAKLMYQDGDNVGEDRLFGNTDNHSLGFITNNIKRLEIDSNGTVSVGSGTGNNTQLHIRTGSLGSFNFESSTDKSPSNNYPFVISRNIDATNNPNTEVGLALLRFPSSNNNQNSVLQEEPQAAITTKGTDLSGDLRFKTKTTNTQYSIDPQDASLTTKLIISKEGNFLLGNDNPNNKNFDLRSSGSSWPIIQGSGSLQDNISFSVGDGNNIINSQLDTIFHVHGVPGSKISNSNDRLVSSFGGDVVVSGSFYLEGDQNITGDIISTDPILNISSSQDINLDATEKVNVKNNLVVQNDITGSSYKGDGLEISNVNKSSAWQKDSLGRLQPLDAIDGNTGVFVIDLGAMMNLINQESSLAQVVYYPTTNTRLYDTYHEISKNINGQVQAVAADGVSIITKDILTERVESPEQLIISVK